MATTTGARPPRGEGPCSLLIDEIEAIRRDIAERDDWGAFEAKILPLREMGALFGADAA